MLNDDNDVLLSGTILGQEDINKFIEKQRKQYAKKDELTKLAFEKAVEIVENPNRPSFGNEEQLEILLNLNIQDNLKQYDPITMMANFEEIEDNENKIISPDIVADFQKLAQTQENDTTTRYNNIAHINAYINFAKAHSKKLAQQMSEQKNQLAKLKTQQQNLRRTAQKLKQQTSNIWQKYNKAIDKRNATLEKYKKAQAAKDVKAMENAKAQLTKDDAKTQTILKQLEAVQIQQNAIAKAYRDIAMLYNNTLTLHNSNEYRKNLADKIVNNYTNVAEQLQKQRENILKQASQNAKDVISALTEQSGRQLTPKEQSDIFQTQLLTEAKAVYDRYLNFRKEYSAIKANIKQEKDIRTQQRLELQKIDKHIAENRQQIQQSITYERSLLTKIQQAKEDLSKNKNTNEQQLQTYNKMLEEYIQLKQKYHTLITERDKLEDKQARLKYDLQPESQKQQTTALQEEKELKDFLNTPTEEEKKQEKIKVLREENKEWYKNFRDSQQTKYTYETYIKNKKRAETLSTKNANLQPQTQKQQQQQNQNVENKPSENYFHNRNYFYSNYFKHTPLPSKSQNSAKQQNINANNKYNIYNRYMRAYLKLNNAQPQAGLQQYNAYRMLRGQKHNLNINIKPQAKGTQQNYFQSYRSYISRITSKGTSNGWTRQF